MLADGYGNDLAFSRASTITTVEMPDPSSSGEARAIKVAVEEWKSIKADTTLELLQFSLKCVRNLDRPYLHFRRAYRKLPGPDMRTITDGEPFVLRTAYYSLLNSLPPSLQEFFEREIKDWSDPPYGRVSLENRLRALLEFIGGRVISVGRLLQGINALIGNSESLRQIDGVDLRHEFATDGAGAGAPYFATPSDDIIAQASYFREFESLIDRFAPEQALSPEESMPARVFQRIEAAKALPEQGRLVELFNYD